MKFIKILLVINFAMAFCLFFLKPESAFTVVGLFAVNIMFAYSVFSMKRKILFPFIIAYFIWFLVGILSELFDLTIIRVLEEKEPLTTILLSCVILGVGYQWYKSWLKGKW